jgi:hypothetical protein
MPHLDRPYRHHVALTEWLGRVMGAMWGSAIRVLAPPCSWIIENTDAWWTVLMCVLLVVTVGIVGWDFGLYGLQRVDWLWITGYPVALFILLRSTGLPDRIFYLRESLINQGILEVYDPSTNPEPSLAREREMGDMSGAGVDVLRDMKGRILPHTALLTVLICFFANIVVHRVGLYRVIPDGASTSRLLNAYANHALGHAYVLLLSLRLGRAVAFSLLMWTHRLLRIPKSHAKGGGAFYRVRLNPQPGHPDGICGLKNILDFWTFEASLLIPPLIYTLFWLAISGSAFCQTSYWSLCSVSAANAMEASHTVSPIIVFFWFSLILIVLQVLALWWPILALRFHMEHARTIVRNRLDAIARKSADLRFKIVNSQDPQERKEAAEQLANGLEAYKDYESIPLWPISRATLTTHLAQLWTLLVFLGVVHQEEKIWPIIEKFLLSP